MLFGSGIGARIKAAIHALPNDCYSRWDIFTEHTGGQASLRQHQGSWRCQHDYQLDPNVRGSLCACRPCGVIPTGSLSDLRLVGPGASSSTIGVYIGGDPAGVISPSASFGDHQNFNRVGIWYFGKGVQWGKNAWDDSFHESVITDNGTGIYYSTDMPDRNSGESISFYSTSIQNNTVQGINLVGYSDFYFYGSRCDYNATCGTVNGAATAHFYGMHFEQGSNTMLTVGNAGPDGRLNVYIDGGQIILSRASGTDAQVFNVLNGAGNLMIRNAMVMTFHPITNFVTWSLLTICKDSMQLCCRLNLA